MGELGTNAYLGHGKNPYGNGVTYDNRTVHETKVLDTSSGSLLLPGRHKAAKRLVEHTPILDRDSNVLDLGAGTGISTLEILLANPQLHITAIDSQPEMLNVLTYKFNLSNEEPPEATPETQSYWNNCRRLTEPHTKQIQIKQGTIPEIFPELGTTFDYAIANQFVHWLDDIPGFLETLEKQLNRSGGLTWNTASHWFEDATYPTEKYGKRYNAFISTALEIANNLTPLRDPAELHQKRYTLEEVKAMTESVGWHTTQEDVYIHPTPFNAFITDFVPQFIKELSIEELPEEDLAQITDTAISRAIKRPSALTDNTRVYEIVPVFDTLNLNVKF